MIYGGAVSGLRPSPTLRSPQHRWQFACAEESAALPPVDPSRHRTPKPSLNRAAARGMRCHLPSIAWGAAEA